VRERWSGTHIVMGLNNGTALVGVRIVIDSGGTVWGRQYNTDR
jgi:hypothetical protein